MKQYPETRCSTRGKSQSHLDQLQMTPKGLATGSSQVLWEGVERHSLSRRCMFSGHFSTPIENAGDMRKALGSYGLISWRFDDKFPVSVYYCFKSSDSQSVADLLAGRLYFGCQNMSKVRVLLTCPVKHEAALPPDSTLIIVRSFDRIHNTQC